MQAARGIELKHCKAILNAPQSTWVGSCGQRDEIEADQASFRWSRAAPRGVRGLMRIGSRIFVVGAVPVATAAFIAVAAILMLARIDQARTGAAVAGTVYRTLLTAVMARNDYLRAEPHARLDHQARFFGLASEARDGLNRLRGLQPQDRSIHDAEQTLAQYIGDMTRLADVTSTSDRMAEDMGARAATLIGLTEQARARQHASNADIVSSLDEDDRKLRAARDIVDAAYATRLALGSVLIDLGDTQREAGATDTEASRRLTFDGARVQQQASRLGRLLDNGGNTRDDDPNAAGIAMVRLASLPAALGGRGGAAAAGSDAAVRASLDELIRWSEAVLKVYTTQYRSFQEQVTELLTYSVQAHETELATQNVAIEVLKLSHRSAEALAQRDEGVARSILHTSAGLSETVASLPISPLIQSDMIEALKRWRDGLDRTTARLRQQNDLIAHMDGASDDVIRAARSLDASFEANADATARSIGIILILGAACALLLGGGVAFVVARSITRPLKILQTRIMSMAHDPGEALFDDDGRRDELGDIARAANIFLKEIARRERALRFAKERADTALDTLRRTQAELIQAEKLASLGQLVAGVAHEINTPIGIALTTSTVVDEETRAFLASARDGRISRGALDRLVERVMEGTGLLTTNLTRAADLIQSFRYVAADQVSGERREFDVATFLHQLVTSLGPMLRKSARHVAVDCADGLLLDSYPGALAQVLTNLVVNATLHAFPDGEPGRVEVRAEAFGADHVRISVGDDGIGIAPEHRAKIFDPFFTTRRARGSTGLGLHIVFNLVTGTLGGRVEVDNAPGRGTRFTIDLPCQPGPAAKALLLEEAV